MKCLFFLLLATLSTSGFACTVGPRDLSWSEMLAAAQGAVVVRAVKVQPTVDDYAIFRLERIEAVADPRRLFRERTLLGVDAPFEDPEWHARVAFWAGYSAGGVRNGSCHFLQRIDPNVPHLLLLGVDGPYALEPIAQESDRWLEVVREYYAQPAPRVTPKIRLDDTLRQITVVEAAGCKFDAEISAAIDSFLTCVRQAGRPSRIQVTLKLNQMRSVGVIATGDEPFVTRQELINELKTDFGWPEKVTLRSLLDGSALSPTVR